MQNTIRNTVVDTLRGWALFIVVISNYLGFAYSTEGKIVGEGWLIDAIEFIEQHLFSAKGWTLLFTLFGFGFGMIYDRNPAKAVPFLAKRMLILVIFALVNSLLFEGDILRDYVFLGLLILPVLHWSYKRLAILAAILFLFIPFITVGISTIDISGIVKDYNQIRPLYTSHSLTDVIQYNWLAAYYWEVRNPGYMVTAHYVMVVGMLAGLALQKSRFFYHTEQYQSSIKKTAIGTLLFSSLGTIGLAMVKGQKLLLLKYFHPHYWIVISTMVCTVCGILLLYHYGKATQLRNALGTIGRMTLTNYMMQNLIGFVVFQGIGFRLFYTMPFYFYPLFAILVFLGQFFFSRWWLASHQYGPLEWCWRYLSTTLSRDK
jgi:uncharacterized protein